jgi:hypothetical protein
MRNPIRVWRSQESEEIAKALANLQELAARGRTETDEKEITEEEYEPIGRVQAAFKEGQTHDQ